MSHLISIISAGAAMGIVRELLDGRFDPAASSFGAVGAMQERFLQGQACDLLIVARHQLDGLAARGLVGAIHDLGYVATGLAVRADHSNPPQVHDAASLRQTVLECASLYVPDMKKSTAGQHIAKMLEQLGISQEMKERIREFPNGATAMKAMAEEPTNAIDLGAAPAGSTRLGCTQATEILYTPGVRYMGALPEAFELKTLYSLAVPLASEMQPAAIEAMQILVSKAHAQQRLKAGFQ